MPAVVLVASRADESRSDDDDSHYEGRRRSAQRLTRTGNGAINTAAGAGTALSVARFLRIRAQSPRPPQPPQSLRRGRRGRALRRPSRFTDSSATAAPRASRASDTLGSTCRLGPPLTRRAGDSEFPPSPFQVYAPLSPLHCNCAWQGWPACGGSGTACQRRLVHRYQPNTATGTSARPPPPPGRRRL